MLNTTTDIIVLLLVSLGLYLIVRRYTWMKRVYELSDKIRISYRALPLIGHAYMALGSNCDRMNLLKKISSEAIKSKHGVAGIWIGMNFYVVVTDPAAADVLTKEVVVKSDMKAFHGITGKYGSVFAPIDMWRHHRKVVLPSFSEKRLRQYMGIFVEHSALTLRELDPMAGKGAFYLWDHVLRYAMTTISRTLFGMDIVDLEEHEQFLHAFGTFSKYVAVKIVQLWLRSDIIFKTLPIYRKMEKQKRIILNFIEKAIEKKQKESGSAIAEAGSVMEMLMETSRRSGRAFSAEELRDELVVLFLASSDTSATAVCFTCLMLAAHPRRQDTAYNE